jgi:selenocysteine lyase/cysteine desulfurase
VASAKASVDYARQSLDAEQKKYQFGTSTTTAVLQTRSALANAESTLMSAMAAYEKSRVELDRAIGALLDHDGISIDDAARGQVTHMPNVPYVSPRKELPTVTTETPQPQSQQ